MYNLLSVLPVYNGEKYLGAALQSLADQEVKPDKVIVQDDGSTDRTQEIVRSFKDLNIEIRRNEKNQGLFPNHNICLQYAQETNYFHLMHADDLLLPAFFKEMLPVLQDAPAPAFAYCGHGRMDKSGVMIRDLAAMDDAGQVESLSTDGFLGSRARLLPDLMLDAAIIKSGGQPLPSQFPLHLVMLGDVIFWSHLALAAKAIKRVRRKLVVYREHLESGSYKAEKDIQSYMEQDWEVINQVQAMRRLSPLSRFIQEQKLKCFYAALARTKSELVRGRNPALAQSSLVAGRAHVGLGHWIAGGLAYQGRKAYRLLTR